MKKQKMKIKDQKLVVAIVTGVVFILGLIVMAVVIIANNVKPTAEILKGSNDTEFKFKIIQNFKEYQTTMISLKVSGA